MMTSRSIPTPGEHPALAAVRYLRSPIRYLRANHARYGDVFQQRFLGPGNAILISSPEATRALFTAPVHTVPAGVANQQLLGSLLGGTSLLTLDGNPHLIRRKLLLPSLHGDRLQLHGDAMITLTNQLIDSWQAGAVLSLLPEFQHLTLQVIMRVVFGLDETDTHHELKRMLKLVADDCLGSPLTIMKPLQWDLGPLSPWGRILRILRRTDDLLYGEIARRRQQEPAGDVLSLLLAARTEEGEPLSALDVRNELMSMLLAGHETTASSTTWLIERLLSHPPVLERLRRELDSVCGNGPLRGEHLSQLPYLDAAIQESLRMRSVFANSSARLVGEELDVAGYRLARGDQVVVSYAVLHFRPEIYPDPQRFLPERFLEGPPNPYAWIPFGGGARRCIGMQFALHQMKAIAATLVRRATLELAGLVAETGRGFMVVPKHGLRVRVVGGPTHNTR